MPVIQMVEVFPEQVDELAALAKPIWTDHFTPIIGAEQTAYMIEKFQSDHAVKDQMAHQNYRYYLAKLGDRYAGFVGFAPRYEGKEEMYLSKVYILSDCRHQGVVRRLFDLVEEEARKEGLSKIRLTVNKHNTHAYEVYQHYGYENVESVKADIGSGYYMDDYVMVKRV